MATRRGAGLERAAQAAGIVTTVLQGDLSKLPELGRRNLQNIAKSLRLKANVATDDLRELITKSFDTPAPVQVHNAALAV